MSLGSLNRVASRLRAKSDSCRNGCATDRSSQPAELAFFGSAENLLQLFSAAITVLAQVVARQTIHAPTR